MTKDSERKMAEEIRHLHNLVNDLDRKISHRTYSSNSEISNVKYISNKSFEDQYKRRLVGNLPYVLLDKKYFSTNNLLVKFAQKNLKLNIKFARSKSRDALIGSIIVEVVKKDPIEIRKFYRAIQRIIGKDETVGVKDFFGEWNKIIKSL